MSLKDEMARILAARQVPSMLTEEARDEKDSVEADWLAEFEEINAEIAATTEPPGPRLPFSPGLPHFVTVGPNQWVETPYATAHCVFCANELAEEDRICCVEHRRQMNATPAGPRLGEGRCEG